jgi:transposase, IS6 family
MAERGLSVDHVTIWRWVQRYAPVLNQRIRRELRHPNRSWRVDETYVRSPEIGPTLYRAGFGWRNDRLHVIAETGSDSNGQAR